MNVKIPSETQREIEELNDNVNKLEKTIGALKREMTTIRKALLPNAKVE
jgi:prefoldin subunit 5